MRLPNIGEITIADNHRSIVAADEQHAEESHNFVDEQSSEETSLNVHVTSTSKHSAEDAHYYQFQ